LAGVAGVECEEKRHLDQKRETAAEARLSPRAQDHLAYCSLILVNLVKCCSGIGHSSLSPIFTYYHASFYIFVFLKFRPQGFLNSPSLSSPLLKHFYK
jgi:hypothetical protein